MYSENVIDISMLHTELMDLDVMPDLKRLYLCERMLVEPDPNQVRILRALLEGYDKGMIEIKFDPWDGAVKYCTSVLN